MKGRRPPLTLLRTGGGTRTWLWGCPWDLGEALGEGLPCLQQLRKVEPFSRRLPMHTLSCSCAGTGQRHIFFLHKSVSCGSSNQCNTMNTDSSGQWWAALRRCHWPYPVPWLPSSAICHQRPRSSVNFERSARVACFIDGAPCHPSSAGAPRCVNKCYCTPTCVNTCSCVNECWCTPTCEQVAVYPNTVTCVTQQCKPQ